MNNQAAVEQNGDVIGKSLLQQSPGVLHSGLFNKFVEATETGIPLDHEQYYNYEQFDGWFHLTAVKMGDGFVLNTENITEKKNAGEEILRLKDEIAQNATDKYYTLFSSIDEGFCIIEMIYDKAGTASNYRFVEVNQSFERQTGLKEVVGKTGKDIMPDDEPYWLETYNKVAQTGKSIRFERYHNATQRWYESYASRVGNAESRQVAIAFNDVTERKRHEQQQQFLLKLSDGLRSLNNTVQIQEIATHITLQHFHVERCYYCEIENDICTIRIDASIEGLPSVAGTYNLKEFPILKAIIDVGKPFVVDDVHTTDLVDESLRQLCIQFGIISYLDVPVIRDGIPKGVLCITQSIQRKWTEFEISLIEEIAERTWLAVERAKAQEALRQSEENIRVVTDNLPALIAYHDREQRYVFASKEFERFFGVPREQILGKTMKEFLAPHVYERLRPGVERALAGERVSFEDKEPDKFGPGLHSWTEENYIPRFAADGTVEGFFVLAHIITERKRTEEALSTSESRFRTLNDAVPQVIWANDAQGKANYFNQRWYDYTGLTYEESASGGWQVIVHPDDEPSSVEKWNAALAAGTIFDTEYRLRRADGVYRWHLGRNVPLKDEGGNVIGWFGSATDIEDLTVAEASLRESEERHRAIVSQTSVGIIRINEAGKFIFINEKARSMFGFKIDNGEDNTTIWDLTLPEDLEDNKRLYKRLLTEGLPFQFEKKLKRLNGTSFWASVSMAPIKNNGAKVQSAVAVINDVTGRKQAEEALRETMERFQYAVRATKDVILEIDLVKDRVWWSSMMQTLFGYSQKEVQHSLTWYQSLIHPDDHKRLMKSFLKAVEGNEELWTDEFCYRQADGSYVYVSNRSFIIRNEEGKAVRMIGAMQDITQRKADEAALRKSEQRLRVALEAGELGTWDWDIAENRIVWNEQHYQLFGVVNSRFDNVPLEFFIQFVHPEDVAHLQTQLEEMIENKGVYQAEFRIIRENDGEVRWMNGYGRITERHNGTVKRASGVMYDTTERKQAEEALQAAQNSLNTALEAAQMGVWDINLITGEVNHSLRHDQLLGFTEWQKDWGFEKAKEHLIPEDHARMNAAYETMLKHGIFNLEARVKRSDGAISWIHYYGRVFRNERGELVHAAGVIFDITDRKTIEQKKDEFIGIASHELKTPVTSIKAYTEILYEQFVQAGDDQSALYLSKLNGQIDRLTGLIKDLLDATRISEGRLLLNESNLDINQLLRDTADEMRHIANKHAIQLELESLPTFKGDRERLQQVFVNLISNAIKYSPDAEKIIVKTLVESKHIFITIQDFGIGMSPETQAKLFERFFRSADPHVSTFPGLGLGLYISLQIVKQHGGTIKVESAKDKGSTFTVILPAN